MNYTACPMVHLNLNVCEYLSTLNSSIVHYSLVLKSWSYNHVVSDGKCSSVRTAFVSVAHWLINKQWDVWKLINQQHVLGKNNPIDLHWISQTNSDGHNALSSMKVCMHAVESGELWLLMSFDLVLPSYTQRHSTRSLSCTVTDVTCVSPKIVNC